MFCLKLNPLYTIVKPDKQGDKLSSSWPIELTSILVKIQEQMALNILHWYLESKSLITEDQAGFWQNRSTYHHTLRFTQSAKKAYTKNERVLWQQTELDRPCERVKGKINSRSILPKRLAGVSWRSSPRYSHNKQYISQTNS